MVSYRYECTTPDPAARVRTEAGDVQLFDSSQRSTAVLGYHVEASAGEGEDSSAVSVGALAAIQAVARETRRAPAKRGRKRRAKQPVRRPEAPGAPQGGGQPKRKRKKRRKVRPRSRAEADDSDVDFFFLQSSSSSSGSLSDRRNAAAAAAAAAPTSDSVLENLRKDGSHALYPGKVEDVSGVSYLHGCYNATPANDDLPDHPTLADPDAADTPYEFFKLFFTDEMVRLIVDETNLYVQMLLAGDIEHRTAPQFLLDFEQLTENEFRTFLACTLYTGIVHMPALRDYWSNSTSFSQPGMRRFGMPVRRYEAIKSVLHFNSRFDEATREDAYYKVRPLLDLFLQRCQTVVVPGKHVSVDEQIVKCENRSAPHLIFMNMPKADDQGYKVWAMCTTNGILVDFMPAIKVSAGGTNGRDALVQMALRLPRAGHHIWADNLFVTYPSMETLYNAPRRTYLAGTLSVNAAGMPKVIKDLKDKKRHIEKGDYMAVYATDPFPVVFSSWLDSKVMLMGGTGASTSESEVERRGRGHGKQAQLAPDLIANYNRYIGGVDQHDQMRKRYKTRRGCRRPYIAFFYYVLETSMVNSYLAFKLKYPNDQRTRKHLWRDVMEALWADDGDVFVHDDRPRQVPRKKKKMRGGTPLERLASTEPVSRYLGMHSPVSGSQRRCRVCAAFETPAWSSYTCDICDVPLCLPVRHMGRSCWYIYHTPTAPVMDADPIDCEEVLWEFVHGG